MKKYRLIGGVLIILAILFAGLFLVPNNLWTIHDFRDRVISYASADNIDVSNLSLFYFASIACCFAGFGLWMNSCRTISGVGKKERNFSDISNCLQKVFDNKAAMVILCVLAFLPIASSIVLVSVSPLIFALAVSFGIGSLSGYKNTKDYVKQSIHVFSIAFMLQNVLTYFMLIAFQMEFPGLINGIMIIGVIILCHKYYEKEERLLFGCSKVLAVLGIFICLMIEICFVLKNRGVESGFISLVFIAGCVFTLIISALYEKKKQNSLNDVELSWKRYFTLSMFSVACLSCIRDVKNISLFESSNHVVSMSEFIHFHKIPIAETFDAHMFSNSLPGVLYYYLNGDYEGAMRTPYTYVYAIILIMALYKILCYMIDRELAYILVLLIPMDKVVTYSVALPSDAAFLVGVFMLPAYLKWKEHKNLKSHFALWLLAACSVMIQLDTGMAFGIAALMLAGYELFSKKDLKNGILFLVTGMSLAVAGLLALLFCIHGQMGLMVWVRQFLKVALSDQNWAITDLTIPEKGLYYIGIPFGFYALTWFLIRFFELEEKYKDIFLFIMIAFALNSKRTIVRHTIHENKVYVLCLITLSVIFISTVFLQRIWDKLGDMSFPKNRILDEAQCEPDSDGIKKKKELKINAMGTMRVLLIMEVIVLMGKINISHPSTTIDNRAGFVKEALYGDESGIVENNEIIRKVNDFVSNTLKEDETFFDFTNSTYLYAYLGMENPVYENQSPALINGKEAQMRVVDTLKKNKERIPLVLMHVRANPIGEELDDILNVDRYYLIAEYVYEEYCKCYTTEDFEFWCLKDRAEEFRQDLVNDEDKDSFYTGDATHKLGYIPYIWANANGSEEEDGKYGEYLCLKVDALENSEEIGVIVRYENGTSDTYEMNILNGEHDYKIRISSDYDWKLSKVSQIELSDERRIQAFQYSFSK